MSRANHCYSHQLLRSPDTFLQQLLLANSPLAMFIGVENEITNLQISRWRYPFLVLLQKRKMFSKPSLAKKPLKCWTALQERRYPSGLINTSGGSGGAIQPESSARGVSPARPSGKSLTGVKGRIFRNYSTLTKKVSSDSSSRIRSRNKNGRIFFTALTSTSQASPLKGDNGGLKCHCTPFSQRES